MNLGVIEASICLFTLIKPKLSVNQNSNSYKALNNRLEKYTVWGMRGRGWGNSISIFI